MHVNQQPGLEKIGMLHANKPQMHIVGKSTYDAQHQYLCASRRKTWRQSCPSGPDPARTSALPPIARFVNALIHIVYLHSNQGYNAMRQGTRLAAIDLGSNSFRLEIGKYEAGQIERVQYLKEPVRQGAGLDENNMLSREAMQRGWACLERFSERLAGFRPEQIRAVGTQTLRQAVNRDVFLEKGSQILGVPIEVISGREEARLIYQGAASLLPRSQERRLVVDIGGRSTELILGRNLDAQALDSFRVGSVTWSLRYFPEGKLTRAAFREADIAAKARLDEALQTYRPNQWDAAYGCSGTISAVSEILTAAGHAPGLVTREGLQWLYQCMVQARHVSALQLEGLKDDRRPVMGGGVSVLLALFDLLHIDTMRVSLGALRQGVLYDLIKRRQPATDIRVQTVNKLMDKFVADHKQAKRVEQVALTLYRQLAEKHPDHYRIHENPLRWAARLHELGTHIAHSQYHRHGAYILEHVEAPGFTQPELRDLSQLVLGQKGKLNKLGAGWQESPFAAALLALRLAVILCHARRPPHMDAIRLQATSKSKAAPAASGFTLTISKAWAAEFPQSHYLLQQEAPLWEKTGIAFKLQVK